MSQFAVRARDVPACPPLRKRTRGIRATSVCRGPNQPRNGGSKHVRRLLSWAVTFEVNIDNQCHSDALIPMHETALGWLGDAGNLSSSQQLALRSGPGCSWQLENRGSTGAFQLNRRWTKCAVALDYRLRLHRTATAIDRPGLTWRLLGRSKSTNSCPRTSRGFFRQPANRWLNRQHSEQSFRTAACRPRGSKP